MRAAPSRETSTCFQVRSGRAASQAHRAKGSQTDKHQRKRGRKRHRRQRRIAFQRDDNVEAVGHDRSRTTVSAEDSEIIGFPERCPVEQVTYEACQG